ncbi:MAG: beta-phosphoglucomutase [Ruminococcaceae bacterium]|nr:beta-phosphoglucomutase [Oscillospiraceae bacterium]
MVDFGAVSAIIFDLDGVLLSTDQYHYAAWKALADELEIPFCEKDNLAFRGVSRMDCMELLLSKRAELRLTEAEKVAYATKKNERYRSLLEGITPAFVAEEVRETLRVLKERGYRLAVGSSSKNSGFILKKTDLDGCFHAIVDGNDISRSKPDPEVFVKAAEALGVPPERCAVIEDAEAGLSAAVSGGMLPIAIGEAKGSHLARLSIEGLGELTQIFDRKMENKNGR